MKLKAKRVIFKHFIPQLNSAMTEYFYFFYTSYLNNIKYEVSKFKHQDRGCFPIKKNYKCFNKGDYENNFFRHKTRNQKHKGDEKQMKLLLPCLIHHDILKIYKFVRLGPSLHALKGFLVAQASFSCWLGKVLHVILSHIHILSFSYSYKPSQALN